MAPIGISRHALKRLPAYLQYLEKVRAQGNEYVTATAIAAALRLNEIQVRKDISAVSSHPGKPMVGFGIKELIRDINNFLRYENISDAVLVGAGALGSALMGYPGFAEYGMHIAAAFDEDPERVGKRVGGCMIYAMEDMAHICKRLNIRIGILLVPVDAAQSVCDRMVESGILAIWNFTPTFLRVPAGILVQNEILASSLAELMRRLHDADMEDGR